ncbi:hypothetical protein R1flu_011356 [Riccia fluitans]|uniref:Uncharacterized protein n=1 Tax=Riccia fluitans TaxID=41844 RepID=A0ABD1Z7K3_9MARC
MLKNNTRILAFNPWFSNLVTRECLEKLAGTRKPSSNTNQHRAKDSSNNNSTTSYRPTPEDDFSRRLDTRTKNPRGVGGGGARRPDLYRHGHQPKSTSSSSVANKFSGHFSHHQQQLEYRRVFRNRRSQSLREYRSRQMLSVLHEEETSPPSTSSWYPATSITSSRPLPPDPEQSSTPEDSNLNTLVLTRNAKGSSFRRFNSGSCNSSSGSESGSSAPGHKRQHFWKRPKGFRSRVVASLVILRAHYQCLLSSLNGRDYSNLSGMSVNSKYGSQFINDTNSSARLLNIKLPEIEHEQVPDYTEFRSVKVRFKRSVSCKI